MVARRASFLASASKFEALNRANLQTLQNVNLKKTEISILYHLPLKIDYLMYEDPNDQKNNGQIDINSDKDEDADENTSLIRSSQRNRKSSPERQLKCKSKVKRSKSIGKARSWNFGYHPMKMYIQLQQSFYNQ
ncbi:hypothetical protein HHI36_022364 [Cryptolaemus montrouzieri]|uniref:Uncharacterized protein n=1 Tax=Cryptolaemus montrouzieri TaxID=559131 RepID=A0ABD2N0U8_9CUCU